VVTGERRAAMIEELLEMSSNTDKMCSSDNMVLDQATLRKCAQITHAEWRQATVAFVGEGRGGKTGTSNSLADIPFSDTASTIGVVEGVTMEVKHATVQGDGENTWTTANNPEKEYEAMLANQILEERQAAAKQTPVSDGSLFAKNTHNDAATAQSKAEIIPGGSFREGDAVEDTPTVGFNQELVLALLASIAAGGTRVSVYDYGGQDRFSGLWHIMLSMFAFYMLVFDMRWLLSNRSRKQHLRVIKQWINSIVVHTGREDKAGRGFTMSRIFIIGTHKDVVRSPSNHTKISNMISDLLRSSIAWPFIVSFDCEDAIGVRTSSLNFFPVDNRLGRSDPVIEALLTILGRELDAAESVKERIPVGWLQLIDL